MNRRTFLAGAGAVIASPSRGEDLLNAKAIAGDRFETATQEYHLADIIAPSAFTLHADAEPYFDEARAKLGDLLDSARVDVDNAAAKTRWGALVVHARLNGGALTLQERLVAAGAARVAPQTDDLALIDRLLALEAQARARRSGLWALEGFRVFNAGAAEDAIGAYHLIEGQVVRATLARGRFYLNFGEDYKTDFTASAASALYRRWVKQEFDLAALEGARVRIRGFVQAINGPSVDLTHRRQVEALERV